MQTPSISDSEGTARATLYKESLLDDVMKFWTQHGIDKEKGGYFTGLDRDGSVYDTDKPVWFLGRFAWMLATCALTYPEDPRAAEWTRLARHGVDFSEAHAFGKDDGQMYFLLNRTGQPLRKRRYVFSECFASMAYAATARAERDVLDKDDGGKLFRRSLEVYQSFRTRSANGSLPPKIDPETRPLRGIGLPTITLNVIQCLRETVPSSILAEAGLDLNAEADDCIAQIMVHVKEERRTVYECLSADGTVLTDCVEGRTLNPGHAIEAAWFILEESTHRANGDDDRATELQTLGLKMLDYMLDWGWDEQYGGILYYRDAEGKPVQDYWHDMKFWWPQNEAEIATLLAWKLTGETRYADWYHKIHNYQWDLFPDTEHGGWFGYFARDGRRTSDAKGNHFKGPFHVPRMMWKCYQILDSDTAS